MATTIIEHLESHLGEMSGGWGDAGGILVASFPDVPERGVVTYATLGLSRTPLPMPDGRTVRLELVVSVYASYDGKQIASFLSTFAEYLIRQDRALLQGDVIGPTDPVIAGVSACAVYSAIPVYFDDSFAVFEGTDPPTVIVGVYPLPAQDALYIKTHGWRAFEDLLEASEVDLWSLDRPPAADHW